MQPQQQAQARLSAATTSISHSSRKSVWGNFSVTGVSCPQFNLVLTENFSSTGDSSAFEVEQRQIFRNESFSYFLLNRNRL